MLDVRAINRLSKAGEGLRGQWNVGVNLHSPCVLFWATSSASLSADFFFRTRLINNHTVQGCGYDWVNFPKPSAHQP